MAKNFNKISLKGFLHSCLLIVFGMAVGFHILPYFFNTNNMDILLETGMNAGRFSIIQDLKSRATAVVKNNVVLVYPDSSTTFYFIIKRGD